MTEPISQALETASKEQVASLRPLEGFTRRQLGVLERRGIQLPTEIKWTQIESEAVSRIQRYPLFLPEEQRTRNAIRTADPFDLQYIRPPGGFTDEQKRILEKRKILELVEQHDCFLTPDKAQEMMDKNEIIKYARESRYDSSMDRGYKVYALHARDGKVYFAKAMNPMLGLLFFK